MLSIAICLLLQDSPFPLAEGNEWTYKETWSDSGNVRKSVEKKKFIEELKAVGVGYPRFPYLVPEGKETVTFKAGAKGALVITYEEGISIELTYDVNKEGIALASKTISVDSDIVVTNAIKKAETFIKTPLKKGDTWKYGQFDVKTGDEEEIEVKAGKFKCTKIVYTNTQPNPIGKCNIIGNPNTIELWVSPGTGIVKQVWETHWGVGATGGVISQKRELQTFKNAGKK